MKSVFETLPQLERERAHRNFAGRYRSAAGKARGTVGAVMLATSIVDDWSWLLLRLSLDVKHDLPDRLVDDLREDQTIVGLIERIGSRVAIPEGFNAAAWNPLPTFEVWKSHFDGEPLPNPWITEDPADQKFVPEQFGEDFARELEIQARGGRSYREEFRRREEARLGDLVKQWDPKQPNPFAERPREYDRPAIEWDVWAVAEQKRLQKENPVLAGWLRKIAEVRHMNPFAIVGKNMTRQMQIEKADPHFARALERAAQFQTLQLSDEAEQAERAASEAKAAAQAARDRAGR